MPPEETGAPPERVDAGMLVLCRVRAQDAGELAAAVGASMDHLRPWMPWANPDAADPRTQRVRVAEADEMWAQGTDYIYSVFAATEGTAGQGSGEGSRAEGSRAERSTGEGDPADTAGWVNRDGALAGAIGLHRRVGDGGIEIGYWIAERYTRRGFATAAAEAITSVALALSGVKRVEIHCDEANTASAAIPRKLGYRLDRIVSHEPEAPGETGRRLIWVRETADAGNADPGGAAW
ncbi:MAG TPA: GNAT family N-acetyltransferase [Streptosporangiaceae bacterium]|nr:GNAT family N-acetyltransferase [Streptosporangiaceae bacterium]